MSTSHCTTACTSAAAAVTRAGLLFDEQFDQGTLDFLLHDSTDDALRDVAALVHQARQALSVRHSQFVALLA